MASVPIVAIVVSVPTPIVANVLCTQNDNWTLGQNSNPNPNLPLTRFALGSLLEVKVQADRPKVKVERPRVKAEKHRVEAALRCSLRLSLGLSRPLPLPLPYP